MCAESSHRWANALFVRVAWSMESGEHMPDKKRFVNELFRVTKPDGRIIIVTWCHRELRPGETKLAPWELKLLKKISTGTHKRTPIAMNSDAYSRVL